MLLSIGILLLAGFALSAVLQKLRLPGLLGMLITGIVIGPTALNLIDENILTVSADLREIALIVILARAGLSLDLKDLKKVGRPAVLMSFVPATFEIAGAVLLAPPLLGVSTVDAAIIGAMLAAVSPAVIVPKMLTLMEKGYGKKKCLPQLVMAGASADDIYAIVLFTSFIAVAKGGAFRPLTLLTVPLAVVTGFGVGILCGVGLSFLFKKLHMRDTVKLFLILAVSFLLVGAEELLPAFIPYSGLLAVMALGGTVLKTREVVAKRLAGKFSKVWVAAELVLFVLLGAAVDVRHVLTGSVACVLVILGALVFRTAGVFAGLVRSGLKAKEKLFCSVAYIPKATVQAAVGAVPLAAGLASGNIILSVAVLSILLTAPLGAVAIDLSYPHLLAEDRENSAATK